MDDPELAVIGSALFGGLSDTHSDAHGWLLPRHFETVARQIVWRAILALHGEGKAVDMVTVIMRVRQIAPRRAVDWVELLSKSTASVPTAANLDHYARAVVRAYGQRQAAQLLCDAQSELLSRDVEDVRERLYARMSQIDVVDVCVPTMADSIGEWSDRIDEWAERGDGLRGCSMGLPSIDAIWHGCTPGTLITLAGRPGQGKTAMALCISTAVVRAGGRVAIFNFETGTAEIASRLISSASGVPLHRILTGKMRPDEYTVAHNCGVDMARSGRMHIWDQTMCPRDMGSVRRRIGSVVRSQGPVDLVVIDHAHCMREPGYAPSDTVRMIDDLVWSAKRMAADYNTCVLLLAQCNRRVDSYKSEPGEPPPRPKLADVKGGGSFEEHSHSVAFTVLSVGLDDQRAVVPGRLAVLKNRNGNGNADVPLSYHRECVRWQEGPDE